MEIPDRKVEISGIQKLEMEHDLQTKMAVSIIVGVAESLRAGVIEEVELEYGLVHDAADVLPDIFSDDIYDLCRPSIKRVQKRLRPKDPAVGYGRPPARFQISQGKSGNPSGRPKRQDDAWSAFRDGLVKLVPLTVDGVAVSQTSVYVACMQLCQQAIKGHPDARRLVRDLIVMLDNKGLLSPPEKRRRRRRVSLPATQREELLGLLRAAIEVLTPEIRESLMRAVLKRSGF